MKLEYYMFAVFVFVLLCIVMLIARFLFGNVKKRSGLLDEKEAGLLKLYRDVEELVNDLYERMQENALEFQRLESLRVQRVKEAEIKNNEQQPEQPAEAPVRPFTNLTENEIKRVPAGISPGSAAEQNKTSEQPNSQQSNSTSVRRREILRLLDEGKTDSQIADTLAITLSEVRLVKGLYKNTGD